MAKNIVELTTDNFDTEISQGYTFVDFWADWCTPCKIIAPTFEKLAESWDGKIKFAKLDVDRYGEIASKYQVQGIPTLLLFKDGQLIERSIGAQPEPALVQFLQNNYKA